MFPSVVRISASGQKSTVVSVPLHKWLIMGPFPAWLFRAGAIAIPGGLQNLEKKRKSRQGVEGHAAGRPAGG